MQNKQLSIVILSFNTRELLKGCLASLEKVKNEAEFEIIVVDNASGDGSAEMVSEKFPGVKLIRNSQNLGFAKGNNQAKEYCQGKNVLFLNSDSFVKRGTLAKTIAFLERGKGQRVGVVTCKMVLPTGRLDKDARRSFITPWIGLTHLFLRLDRLFPTSRLFSQYWYGYIPSNKTHEIDVAQGSYMLVRKEVLDEVGWFDEDYFLDGEDIDLCWRIKEAGWKIYYFADAEIVHHKGASKGKFESSRKKAVPLNDKIKFRTEGVDSMEKFYRKRLWSKYPLLLNYIVIIGIRLLKFIRITKTILFG